MRLYFAKLNNWFKENWLRAAVFFVLLAWCKIFLSVPINLVTADLGRHIINGRLFIENNLVSHANLFSFTYPDFAFINHHWGSGVIFYFVEKVSGFAGLSFFYILLSLITFSVLFFLAKEKSSFGSAAVVSLIVIPLIGERAEVRPEVFSYFLGAIFLLILSRAQDLKISVRWLFLLPILAMLWVNLHIYFIFGIGVMGLFLTENIFWLFYGEKRKRAISLLKSLIPAFVLALAALFINPFGWKAIIYPFKIFGNYGYRVVENQSVLFLEKLGFYRNANLAVYEFVVVIFLLVMIFALIFNRKKMSPVFVGLGVTVSALAFFALRNFALFGYFILPALSYFIYCLLAGLRERYVFFRGKEKATIIFLGVVFFIFTFFQVKEKILNNADSELGLVPGVNKSADFFKKEKLEGPIMNNYDIGGYLIYHLYPAERVFTDNRPEAYPADFFREIYIPAQEDGGAWKALDNRYGFNVIYYYLGDATPWGQKFLTDRIDDPEWAPVYADSYAIIFVKNVEKNKSIIERFRIPRKFFNIRS
ncbi:MAG: hypothetical protein WCW25_05045 [Patescibacteria group bacterium]|jgi:hypothetical protein